MEYADRDEVALTAAGYRQLRHDPERLKALRLPEVTARLRQAREFAGDVSDDPEYRDAMREREDLEERIDRLEAKLQAARVLEPASVPPEQAVLGSWVELEDTETAAATSSLTPLRRTQASGGSRSNRLSAAPSPGTRFDRRSKRRHRTGRAAFVSSASEPEANHSSSECGGGARLIRASERKLILWHGKGFRHSLLVLATGEAAFVS